MTPVIDHVAWPSIEEFHTVRRAPAATGVVTFRSKVKLHGSNAGVVVRDGTAFAQSRTRLLTPTADNLGFAAWLEGARAAFESGPLRDGVFFGEWCGERINPGVAVAGIGRRVFAVFAVLLGDELMVGPEAIAALLPAHPDVVALPWHGPAVTVDFADRASLVAAVDACNALVGEVEACDPWVKAVFGVEGVGEGVVFYPADGADAIPLARFAALAFKAKGAEHKMKATAKPVNLDPAVVASAEAFVDLVVTEERLRQGLREVCGGVPDVHKTKAFIDWLADDVGKESVAELAASGLGWKAVVGPVRDRARAWFKAAYERID